MSAVDRALEVRQKFSIPFDPANQFGQNAYDILSARVQWTDPTDRWTVAVFGDNLFDETYLTQVQVGTAAAGTIYGEPVLTEVKRASSSGFAAVRLLC